MNKTKLSLFIILFSGPASAQIGMNTPNPKATLDITAKNPTGNIELPEGMLTPRVDRERAQSMKNIETSTLIYVDSIFTGDQTGNAENIDTVGFYHFDAATSKWIKHNGNIYNTDGTVTENRTVKQEDKTLAFTGTATNSFSIDNSTFSVDASNNRVGIGTTTPNSDLQVVGNELRLGGPSTQAGTVTNPLLRIHSSANTDGLGGEIRFNEDNPDYGYYIRHNTGTGNTYGLDGLAIGSASPGNYSYNPAKPGVFVADSQNIGFGTATPQTTFHIDAAKDNNINTAPTSTQQANDVAVSNIGTVGIGNLSPRGALDINKGGINNYGLVLPTNTNVNNFTNPLGGSVIAGTIIYDSTNDCVRFYKKNGSWSKCLDGDIVSPETGTVVNLDCAGANNTGTLTSGQIASGVSSTIAYAGGNGGNHSGQTVSSTGVTGLTATLSAGNFNTGNGSLVYTITGTPTSSGTASFAINMGGKTCILTRSVITGAGAIQSLNCAGANNNGILLQGVSALAISSVISYTGGNGGTHSGQIVTSTGVTGLTATLSAGNFANGNGTLMYTITGTPSSSGTASFAINIGGQTCILTRTVSEHENYNCTSVGRFPLLNKTRYVVCAQNLGGPLFPTYFQCPVENGIQLIYHPELSGGRCYLP